MRLTEFWDRMRAQFGRAYAESVASDYVLPGLGTTVADALDRGEDPKRVWTAVCAEFEVPAKLR